MGGAWGYALHPAVRGSHGRPPGKGIWLPCLGVGALGCIRAGRLDRFEPHSCSCQVKLPVKNYSNMYACLGGGRGGNRALPWAKTSSQQPWASGTGCPSLSRLWWGCPASPAVTLKGVALLREGKGNKRPGTKLAGEESLPAPPARAGTIAFLEGGAVLRSLVGGKQHLQGTHPWTCAPRCPPPGLPLLDGTPPAGLSQCPPPQKKTLLTCRKGWVLGCRAVPSSLAPLPLCQAKGGQNPACLAW